MLRPFVLAAIPALMGCQSIGEAIGIDIEGVEEVVSGLTDPMVAQAIVIGVEPPSARELEPLVEAGLVNPGVTVQVFLADAADAADMANAPINGADVIIETPDDAVRAAALGTGSYAYEASGEVAYVPDDLWTLWADAGREKASWVDVVLPPAAELDLPAFTDADTELALDFRDQGYHSAIVTVFQLGGGPTWTNYPTSINEVYERSLAHDPLEEIVIPGAAFPRRGVYGIAVAAMVHNDDEQLGEVNKLLSRGLSGLMRVESITVR
jgi:hypothetical protein